MLKLGTVVVKANVPHGKHMMRKQILLLGVNNEMFLPQIKNICRVPGHKFCFRDKVSQFSHHESNVD